MFTVRQHEDDRFWAHDGFINGKRIALVKCIVTGPVLLPKATCRRSMIVLIQMNCIRPWHTKNSLRTFLSLCAGESLSVHQADVKAAFLQAPLLEKIYLRAPPGYSTTTADGEEEILELSQAIYGLHQSSAAFYEALSEHLIAKGFAPIMGDPCVFRRLEPDGKVVLICTYVDDLTIGVTDQAQIPGLMSELRERFEIDSSEGGPIEYLLGIAVDQNIEAGTVHLSM